MATYTNTDESWGEVGIEVTAQWYGSRAVELSRSSPMVEVTTSGLVIDGVIVAIPSG